MNKQFTNNSNLLSEYYYGEDALDRCAKYCEQRQLQCFHLVCDRNTYHALGERVESYFSKQGWEVNTILLQGKEIVTDESNIQKVLDASEEKVGIYLGVGSGTITDITRYCSHLRNVHFISLPTAPSVDGFASVVVPIVVGKFKDTAYGKPPIAIFADSQTLCNAPRPMIAAGFGDMLGKFTALADWQLDQLLWEVPYNEEIANRMRRALLACVDNVNAIRVADPQGIGDLMYGLVESGICMMLNGNSRPASGAEHHLSHLWEMQLLKHGKPAILHGSKVGIGTVLISQRWQQVASLTAEEVQKRLQKSKFLNVEEEIKIITSFFGENAERVIKEQERFLGQSENDFYLLKTKISSQWDKIVQLANSVPSSNQIIKLLEQVGCPTKITEIGMSQQDETDALRYAHYLRNQFTVNKLGRELGIWE